MDTGDFLTDVVSLLAGHRERQMQQEAEEKVKLETGKRQVRDRLRPVWSPE